MDHELPANENMDANNLSSRIHECSQQLRDIINVPWEVTYTVMSGRDQCEAITVKAVAE